MKVRDIVIEEYRYLRDGMDLQFLNLIVYADKGMLSVLRATKGVLVAYDNYTTSGETSHYLVYLDPRYDLDWVKAEIEAQIKCAE